MKTKKPTPGSGGKHPQSHTTQRNRSRSGSTPPEDVPGVQEDERPRRAEPLNENSEIENPHERHSHREDEPYDEEGPGGALRLDDVR